MKWLNFDMAWIYFGMAVLCLISVLIDSLDKTYIWFIAFMGWINALSERMR
jgi:hypothetical protein